MFICFIMIFKSSLTCWRYPHHFILGGTQLILIWVMDLYAISQIGHFWNYIFNPQEFSAYTSSPVNSTYFAAPAVLHLGAPAVLLFLFRSPCCAASWSPCCAPLSGTPAVFQLIWRECRCQQNLLLTNTKNYAGRDRTKL